MSRVQRAAAELSHGAPGAPVNWLSNLLPTGKEESSEPSSTETTPSVTPTHQVTNALQGPFGTQKPVNLLSESGPQPGRQLSEREQRDCEVIGNSSSPFKKTTVPSQSS